MLTTPKGMPVAKGNAEFHKNFCYQEMEHNASLNKSNLSLTQSIFNFSFNNLDEFFISEAFPFDGVEDRKP